MTSAVVDKLLAKAHEYELNAEAAKDRGEIESANGFRSVEVALREFAGVVDEVLADAA
jgi:hypothetical protein